MKVEGLAQGSDSDDLVVVDLNCLGTLTTKSSQVNSQQEDQWVRTPAGAFEVCMYS